VVLHARAAAQISEYDNGGSHVTVFLLLGLGSATLALILTPVIGRGSARLGLVDAPGGRKVHLRPVPRTGGVAVVLAATVALAVVFGFVPESHAPTNWPVIRPVIIAAAIIFLVGLVDDLRGLRPLTKLVFESAAAIIVMSSGLLIERVTLLGYTWHLGWLAWPVTYTWLVGLTNAFNLLDGVDGLAAGISALAGAACVAILIAGDHSAEAMLLTAFVGAALGFLVFNFQPASIYLGDSGSLIFGFLLAATALAGWQKGATALAAGVPILIFALPIADSGTTLLRRGLALPPDGRSLRATLRRISQPDREHIHHRLLALGWSERRTVLILYAITAVLSLFALATARVGGS
jgi:UDP-GlcNAc:undecaprenyl-phosphate GlcNAc-1-phosphate transferase